MEVVGDVLGYGLPLLVVDDGSVDATASLVRTVPVNLLAHRSNRGKGAALRTGFAWALEHGFSGVVTLDADGQHDPSAIPLLVATARERDADVLIASRFTQFQEMAGLRAFWNRFGVWCVRKRTGFDVSDTQSGFRYYSTRLLRGVELGADGYSLEMEIIMKAWQGGYRVDSLAVPARVADGRATSHYRPVRDTWNICMTFLRYMHRRGN
jgi:glycosyltransferase involved in cell wall biosynthesis